MTAEFKDARLKVRRAEKHINDLKRLVGEFAARKGHRIISKYDAAADVTGYRFETTECIPENINLVFGDAVHCLRVAFDHAIFAMVTRLNPTAPAKSIQFPIHQDLVQAKAAFNNTASAVGAAFATDFGKTLAPVILECMYPKGIIDPRISDLHKLDLIDKHRLLITCVMLGGSHIDEVTIGAQAIVKNVNIVYKPGPDTGLLSVPGNGVKAKFKPLIQIRTDEMDVTSNAPLVEGLERSREFVSEAINIIERSVIHHGGFQ